MYIYYISGHTYVCIYAYAAENNSNSCVLICAHVASRLLGRWQWRHLHHLTCMSDSMHIHNIRLVSCIILPTCIISYMYILLEFVGQFNLYIYVYTNIHMYLRVFMYIYTHLICIRMGLLTYNRTYLHAYICIYLHTYMHIQVKESCRWLHPKFFHLSSNLHSIYKYPAGKHLTIIYILHIYIYIYICT